MHRLSLAAVAFGAAAFAQEQILPLGFASNAGPPTDDAPIARLKDNNQDGVISGPLELAMFMAWQPTSAPARTGYPSGVNFMTDARMEIEDGEPAFYFTDSEEGRVLRAVDANHNGFLDNSEVTVFFDFGLSSTGAGLFAPDTLATWRDTANNRTIVYVALDNSAASSLGFTHGIYRLVDANHNGNASDAGEATPFVNSTMALTVPGQTGPVTIARDFWAKLRVAPGGKLLAFAQGARLTASGTGTYTIQPDMNAWYGFTDNNGTAVPEVWFNGSTLNSLPLHPDFASGRFPNWDIQEIVVPPAAGKRSHFGGFLGIVPGGGPGGADVYYIGCTYNTNGTGDVNLNGQNIAGLYYRAVDANHNHVIDPGELSLWCNLSNNTYDSVAPVSFTDPTNSNTVSMLTGRSWGADAAPDGSFHITYVLSTIYSCILKIQDTSGNGVVETGEVTVPTVIQTGASPYPFDQALGPFYTSLLTLPEGLMPGPFATAAQPTNGTLGVTTIGDGCVVPATGLKLCMDTWNGNPQVGNAGFKVGTIRGLGNVPNFLLADFNLAPSPVPLSIFGLSPTCFGYLQSPATVGFVLADGLGRAQVTASIPNTPILVGASIAFQGVAYDPTGVGYLPYYSSNALRITVQ